MRTPSVGKSLIFFGYVIFTYVTIGTFFPAVMMFNIGRLAVLGLIVLLAGKVFVLENEVKNLKQILKDERELPDL